jgi:hypothetical protein
MPPQPLERAQARISRQPGVCAQRSTSSVQALHKQLAQASAPAQLEQLCSKEAPGASIAQA